MVIFTGTGEVGAPIIGIDMVGIAITVTTDGSIMGDQDMTVIIITLVGDMDQDLTLGLDLTKLGQDLTLDLDLLKFMGLDPAKLGLGLVKFMGLDPAKLGLGLVKFTDLDPAKLGLDLVKSDLGRKNDLIKVVRICMTINDKL